jgi:hypothetical protein
MRCPGADEGKAAQYHEDADDGAQAPRKGCGDQRTLQETDGE